MLTKYLLIISLIFPAIMLADIISGIIAGFLSYLYTKIIESKYK